MWTLGFPRAQWGQNSASRTLTGKSSTLWLLSFSFWHGLATHGELTEKNVREPGSLALFGIANFVTSSAS